MGITREDLLNAARLGNLQLTAEEEEAFLAQFTQVLNYIDKIKEVPTEGVAETNQGLDLTNVFREDVVIPSLSNEEALASAAETDEGQFKVPAIIE